MNLCEVRSLDCPYKKNIPRRCNDGQISANSFHDFATPDPQANRDANTAVKEDPNSRFGSHQYISSCGDDPKTNHRSDSITKCIGKKCEGCDYKRHLRQALVIVKVVRLPNIVSTVNK